MIYKFTFDCDWGIETANISDADDSVLNITWDHGFAIVTQKITVTMYRKLQIKEYDHFVDNSGCSDFDSVYVFTKR